VRVRATGTVGDKEITTVHNAVYPGITCTA